MLHLRRHLSSQFIAKRQFSYRIILRQSSLVKLRQLEDEKKYEEFEDEVHRILTEGRKENVEETLETLKRVNNHYKLSKYPLFIGFWRASQIFHQNQDLERAFDYVNKALESTPHTEEAAMIIPHIKMGYANILKARGDPKQASKVYLEALQLFGNPTNENSIHIATAYYELGEHFVTTKNFPQAMSFLEQSISLAEGLNGWTPLLTTQASILLSRLYFDLNRLDMGIIVAEKALVGIEFHQDFYDTRIITMLGTYLAKAYEKKRHYMMQQNVVTRTFHILQRRGDRGDPQTFKECCFKLETLAGAVRFHRGEHAVALKVFENIQRGYIDSDVLSTWRKHNPQEADFELAYMLYFKGVTLIAIDQVQKGQEELKKALALFKETKQTKWAEQCEQNLKQSENLPSK